MKQFHVWYDLPVNGILVEKCFTVEAEFKFKASYIWQQQAPKGAIFRSVKTAITDSTYIPNRTTPYYI